ncbi:MAG: hypothetical protein ABIT38_19995 [Gemmatimonadaceae bacterium]
MDVDLNYRTELADQFIERLARLSPEQWREVVAHNERDGSYYQLAVELVNEATQLVGSEKVAQYETALNVRRRRVSAIVSDVAASLTTQTAATASTMAICAMHALMMRDRYGFNAGAFGILIGPFRPYVDLPELERTATRLVTPLGVPRQPSAEPR